MYEAAFASNSATCGLRLWSKQVWQRWSATRRWGCFTAWLVLSAVRGPLPASGQAALDFAKNAANIRRPAWRLASQDLFSQERRPLPDEGQLRRELPTTQTRTAGWLDAAARLTAAANAAWQKSELRTDSLLGSAEMARDVRLAVACQRREPAARRLALQEHVRVLRDVFDKIDALHRRHQRGGEMIELALAGGRLAQACADLAADMHRPADQLANLKIRIAWADLLADAYAQQYHTETTGAWFRTSFDAAAEPCFARIEWAQLAHDGPTQLDQCSRLQGIADQFVRKVSALYSEAARGGEEENLAYAQRALARASARRARAAGDPGAQRQWLESAVRWSNRLVNADDLAFDLGICTPAELSLAQRGLADDRLALASFCHDRSTPPLARTDLLVAATMLHVRIRSLPGNRPHAGSDWERSYVGCAQALAEWRIWSPCDGL